MPPSPTSDQPTSRLHSSTYVYLSSLYFLTVGVLYLWGYWAPFRINILEYLSLTDVVKVTAYPIASAFLFAAIGVVFGELAFGGKSLPSGGGRDTRVGRLLRRFAPVIIALYFSGTYTLWLLGPAEKWMFLPMLVAVPVALAAKEQGFLEFIVPSDRHRTVAILLVVGLPLFGYGHGRVEANAVMTGKRFQYLLSRTEGIEASAEAAPERRPRFLGHAGDHYFLFDPVTSAIWLAKSDSAKPLVLKSSDQSSQVPGLRSDHSVEPAATGKPASAADVKR